MNLTDQRFLYCNLSQKPGGLDIVQPCYHGRNCKLTVNKDGAFSLTDRFDEEHRNGQMQPGTEGIYIGEFLMYTDFASAHSDIQGKFFIYDCWSRSGIDIRGHGYFDRYKTALRAMAVLSPWCKLVPSHSASEDKKAWELYVGQQQFPGLVFKRVNSTAFDPSYVCRSL